jgi:hypothetical protein
MGFCHWAESRGHVVTRPHETVARLAVAQEDQGDRGAHYGDRVCVAWDAAQPQATPTIPAAEMVTSGRRKLTLDHSPRFRASKSNPYCFSINRIPSA